MQCCAYQLLCCGVQMRKRPHVAAVADGNVVLLKA
jgi:hypothetical protein